MQAVRQGFLLTVLILVTTLAPSAQAESNVGLPATAATDTVRTNLWLTEALMAEIVEGALLTVPPAPGAVRLAALRDDPRNDLFQAVAANIMADRGYELFLPGEDPAREGAVDYIFGYSVQDIDLTYPDVGRTLGLWRSWVERDLAVSVLIEISEESSGRLLLNERVERRFGDRLASDDFADVDSDVYDFTTADMMETGWKSRVEEIVVLSTLAGLVAIYFANTGD